MLKPLDSKDARRFEAWVRGPEELELVCRGNALARAATWVHRRWPLARGQVRLVKTLAALQRVVPAFEHVTFESSAGVRLSLDMTGRDFLYLSGRLPPEPLQLSIVTRLVRPGDVFVDVGAHKGLFVAHVLGRLGVGGRYHAFEPSQGAMAFLTHAFESDPRLVLHACALSDKEGEAVFEFDGKLKGRIREGAGDGVRVPIARLDASLADEPTDRPWMIKIDVEGHEPAVLAGAKGLFERGIEPAFFLEYLESPSSAERHAIDRAIEEHLPANYRVYGVCTAHGAVCEGRFEPGSGHRGLNLLVLPPTWQARLDGVFR
ncbi:MAG: FkbM family methyltransferase [Myxococcales bacterium]|nr:FkbM family methyltransferase [Myxococcales bacterium]